MNKKICIVDDDLELVELLKEYLNENGFSKVYSLTGKQIIELQVIDFDLIILDIMMPDIDGFEVCKNISQRTDAFIIFLSAKVKTIDKILGIELGADDYLTKPFEPRELLVRINSLFRREKKQISQNSKTYGKLEFVEFSLDLDKQILVKDEKKIELTTYENTLLEYFCINNNLILSREQIIDHLNKNDISIFDRTIDKSISRLRKKIEDDKETKLIKTVWGRGYKIALTNKN